MDKLEQALRDPSQIFKSPREVIASNDFSTEQKIEIVRHWAYDQLEMMIAEEEANMLASSRDKSLYDEALLVLEELNATLP